MTFLKKLHMHPLLILFIVLSIMTGTFVQLMIVFTIIFIHELGHYLMANRYKWHIQSIVLWVFGGVMQTSESTNRPIREDILVTLAGPLQHVWMFAGIYSMTYIDFIPSTIIEMAYYYNWLLLAFNLLPIYPLDGGKLLFYVMSLVLPFKKAHQYTYRFSMMVCISLILSMILIYPMTLSAFLLLLFLLFENYREWKHHPYTFMRFLLNRYPKKKTDTLMINGDNKLIDVFSLFRRNRYHQLKIIEDEHVISETKALDSYFDKQRVQATVFQIAEDR